MAVNPPVQATFPLYSDFLSQSEVGLQLIFDSRC